MRTKPRSLAVSLSILVAFGAGPARAHNARVHQPMTDFAYQVMRLAALKVPRVVARPGGISAQEWDDYLAAIDAAVPKLKVLPASLPTLPASRCVTDTPAWSKAATLGLLTRAVSAGYATSTDFDCGSEAGWSPGPVFEQHAGGTDYTGTGLGFWAQSIDDEVDDFHGWWKPTNFGGSAGKAKELASEGWDTGLGILLLPAVCFIDCVFGLFGSCDACVETAKQLSEGTNPVKNLEELMPGFGDWTGPTYTGLWHFINVRGGVSNEYDDRQGMLYEEAGPFGVPGAVDMAIMVVTDIGITINYQKSLGPKRYQISGATDSHPNTKHRDEGDWEMLSLGHTTFEPLDNLAYFGWRKFVADPAHSSRWLGWPLHALGDATVPMHVTGTTLWGHRPFEDAQERLYPSMVGAKLTPTTQEGLARSVLLEGFAWFRFVRSWQAEHGSAEVPVRDLVTALAKKTLAYSQDSQQLFWPYNDAASTEYLLTAKETATDQYIDHANAVELGRPLLFSGQGATIAFLAAAMEVVP
ncbi:MAG: hypothetical protein IPJ65_14245 [Archangiaceae bacterium]|nr:hypothetical protein [Archangiaceae bacterium]